MQIKCDSQTINEEDLKKTKKILDKNINCSVVQVKKYAHTIQRSFSLSKKNKIVKVNKNFNNTQTQKIGHRYHDVGQFYWGKASSSSKHKNIFINSIAYPINRIEYIDVDNSDDWLLLKRIFELSKYI